MEFRKTFEQVADLYADVRRGYPAALFEALVSAGALGPSTAVLEVGCGTGQATGDLATRAGRVVALDPGERLVAHARHKIDAAHVGFEVARFEDFDAPAGSFDLVASAQAWHWVDPEIGFSKAAGLLSDGGYLAIFGHVPVPARDPLMSAFKATYDIHLPGVWGQPSNETWYQPDGPVPSMIASSGLFQSARHSAFSWTWSLDPVTFGRYLRTDSSYHVIEEAARFALFDALCEAVTEHGGVYVSEWETHLYLASKA